MTHEAMLWVSQEPQAAHQQQRQPDVDLAQAIALQGDMLMQQRAQAEQQRIQTEQDIYEALQTFSTRAHLSNGASLVCGERPSHLSPGRGGLTAARVFMTDNDGALRNALLTQQPPRVLPTPVQT